MKQQDFLSFMTLWKETQGMFNKNVSDTAVKLAFGALIDFTLEDVKAAITVSLRESKFAPTVADIVEIMKKVHGIDKETLSIKANIWYTTLNECFDSGKDIITDDSRAVYAFKMCFGSLVEFGMHDKKSDPFDRKNFIECYVNANNHSNCYLIAGRFHSSNSPRVAFIGDSKKCLAIAKEVYDDYQRPQLPTDKPKQLQVKREVTVEYSENCNEQLKDLLENFLSSVKR